MRAILLIVVFTALCLAILPGDIVELNENSFVVTKTKVDRINSIEGNTWKASTNQGSTISTITVGEIRKFLGFREGGPQLEEKVEFEVDAADVPDTFDSREHWPDCPTIKNIRDQSACGSCWAFGAGEAISDRYCTYGVNKNLSVATADIGFCCGSSCGYGCEGGFPSAAFQYWLKKGVVSEQCYPYPFPSCDHHVPNSKNPCPSDIYPTPKCPNKCVNGDSWANSKHFASKAFAISSGEKAIQQEIFANGPVETAFTVYDDFPTYKSGVYKRTSNRALGGHAVKFVGWGVENGVKYWLVANSWNANWGDQGYFKILRGKNECGIENQVWGGVPKN